ncbi:MAG: glycosyltransferase family 39 protein [Deltaproteobacteria bacterium]|nr:glycosyltransferase family 39 protein [Deltaproteobacteria bacterium]
MSGTGAPEAPAPLARRGARGGPTRWIAAAALVAAVFACYAGSLGGGFVFDDHLLVERSALLRGPLWRIWLTADAHDYWPLTYSSLWLEWRAFGLQPLGYRLVGLALHAAAAVLLWRVLARLRVPGAWLGALLFAVHPVGVESVAWISERKNALSAPLLLASTLCWLRFRDDQQPRSAAGSAALFLAALLAKTSAVILPPALLLAGAWQQRPWTRRERPWLAALFGLAAALGAVTLWFQRSRALGGLDLDRSALERLAAAAWSWPTYLWTAFQPFAAAVVYPDPPPASSPWAWLPLAAGLAAVAAAAGLRRRLGGGPLLALAYHAVAVLPVLGLLDMAFLVFSPAGNHLQYLALLGPCALAGAALGRLVAARPSLGTALAVAAAGALCWHTAGRAAGYRDDVALWSLAVREAPGSLTAARMLGGALSDAGRPREALQALSAAEERFQDPAARLRIRALRLALLDRGDEAVAAERAAAPLRDDLGFEFELGVILTRRGRAELGVPLLREVVARQPRSAENRYQLAAALVRSGRAPEAVEELRVGCRLSARSGACGALALVLQQSGRGAEARGAVAAALGLAPADPAVDEALQAAAPRGAP